MLTYLSCKQSPTSAPLRQKNRGFVSGGTLRDVAHAPTAAPQAGNHDSQFKRNQSAGTLMDCLPPLRTGTLGKAETCGIWLVFRTRWHKFPYFITVPWRSPTPPLTWNWAYCMYRYGILFSKVSSTLLLGYAMLNTGKSALHFLRQAALRRMWRMTRRLSSADALSLSRLTELQLRLQKVSLSRSSRWSRRLSSRYLMLSAQFFMPYCSSA